MSRAKDKRLVYIPGNLVAEIKEISRRRGESLSLYVSDILKLGLKADNLGYGPKQAAEFLDIMRSQRNLGGVFVPTDVLEFLNESACGTDLEELKKKWYASGKWHGKYIIEKFSNPIQTLRSFLEATRWDLSEVEVANNESIVKFRCISTLLNGDSTQLLARFIEGAMHSMDYKTKKSDSMKGMILLEFTK